MREWIAHVELLVTNDAGQHERDEDVKDGADHQRIKNSAGQIALRVFAFFSGSGNGVEADERPENRGYALKNASQSIRGEGRPVLWVDVEEADDDDGDNHEKLHGNQNIVGVAALFDPDVNQSCD